MASDESVPQDYANWLTPPDAVRLLEEIFGTDSHSTIAKVTLLEHLRGHAMRAIAGTDSPLPYWVPASDWQKVESDSLVWTTSVISFQWHINGKWVTTRHFSVRFDPVSIQSIIESAGGRTAAIPSKPGENVEPKNKGGAPRKEWWDDFWIAICGQIYEGKLLPKTQAELQAAMLDWASQNGHDMSETSAKVASRRLFRAWDLGGKN